MKQKVLMITHNYPRHPGDHWGKFIQDLCKGLDKHVLIEVLAPKKIFFIQRMSRSKALWLSLKFIWEIMHYSDAYPATNPLDHVEYIRKDNPYPAIINAHWWLPSGVGAYLLSRKIGVPYIITAHGTEINIAAKKWWLKPLARFILTKAQKVICVSKSMEDSVSEIAPKAKTAICSMPYDDDLFYVGDELKGDPITNGFTRIIAVGSLVENKGFEYLIQAMAGTKWLLDIYGEGDYEWYLKNLASILKDRVRFNGAKRPVDLAPRLRISHIFVSPSLTEGFGMAIIEAMACGVPVIATDTGGSMEIITHGINGSIVKKKNIEQLHNEIAELAGNKYRYDFYRKHGLITAEHYTKEAIAKRYVKILGYHNLKGLDHDRQD